MGLTFSDSDAKSDRQGRLRRVPDYRSRPMKLRLFVMVAAFILVLFVAEKARDPRSWQWFFALESAPAAKKIDNRLPPGIPATAGDSEGAVVVASEDSPPAVAADELPRAPAFDPVGKAWSQGLKTIWISLPSDQRTILYRLLECAADEKLWPAAERADAETTLAALAQLWTGYHQEASQSVGELEGEERTRWENVLRTVDSRMTDEVLAPLETLAGGSVVLRDQQQQLNRFLADLDRLNLSRVVDDGAFMRPDDNQIWHHFFWQLMRGDDAALAADSKGEISYAQIYRQPGVYRGQVITVRGAVRRAYRVPASRNHLGIKEYFVYWVQPFESADTPLVVYALDAPPGFPPLKDRDRDGELTRLNEEVTFHGFLFKRGAYAGQHGTYNAPLLLARAPKWRPAALALGDANDASPRTLWQAGIFALALAVLISAAVYWTSFRRARLPRPHDERAITATLRSLQDEGDVQSPREALRQIELQAQREGDRPANADLR